MSPTTTDTFDVIICGCGPTGAVLSANLGRLRVNHVVLEREPDITTDPRGIALDEDGIRIAQGVGIYEALFKDVGKSMGIFQFIQGGKGLDVRPFLQFDYKTIEGGTGHVGFMCHKQPAMEKHLRSKIDKRYGTVRSGSTVTAISEDADHVYVDYKDSSGGERRIRAKFLVGADGKTGFVRKKYLESRGVLMEKDNRQADTRAFRYEAVWVALNLHITLPTPETHPEFPLWRLGYTPEQVYDLFFPHEFNFICDPARPSVCGRFGRTEDRLWRYEFVVKPGEDGQVMASPEETQRLIFPYITHHGSRYGLSQDVPFPPDCIDCIRSRPFSFSARSCNKWSLGRVILCGDSAHVFPPFGGQGIASGFRDAISLSWRLKVAVRPGFTRYEALLAGWAAERKQQLERSLASTIENGNFCNEPSRIKAFIRNWYLWTYQLIPSWKHDLQLGARREGMTKYDYAPGMPFLPQYQGGKSFPQVFSAPIDGPAPPIPTFTDDTIFAPNKTGIFQIVALLDSVDQFRAARADISRIHSPESELTLDPAEATYIVHGEVASIHDAPALLGKDVAIQNVIRVLGADEYTAAGRTVAALEKQFPRPDPLYYDPNRIRKDLGNDKVYVVVRWDRFVFAACRNAGELERAVAEVESTLQGVEGGEMRMKI